MEDWSSWSPHLANLEKMLNYRSYTDIRSAMSGSDVLLACTATDPQGGAVWVYFVPGSKAGVKTLRRIHSECKSAECRHIIIVTEDGVTPFAAKEFEDLSKKGEETIEIFKKKELSFCIVEHDLVPQHQLLNAVQKKEFLQSMRTKLQMLPRLKSTDPIAKFMNFPVGGIVRIKRSDGEIYYRVVVH